MERNNLGKEMVFLMARSAATSRFLMREMNKSLSLVATNDFLKTTGVTPSTTNFNLAFWLQIPNKEATSDRILDAQGTGASGGFVFQTLADGRIVFNLRNLTTTVATTAFNYTVGRWAHFVITYQVDSCNMYMNGQLIATDTSCTMTSTDQQITFGRNSTAATGQVTALFNEFIFSNTAPWSAQEVADLYYRGKIPAVQTVYYKFADNVLDSSGNGNNGSLTGGSYTTNKPISTRSIAPTRTPTGLLRLPGVDGNNASTPNAAALNITGSLDLQFLVEPAHWRPSSAYVLASMYAGSGQRAFQAFLLTSGALRLTLSANGSTATSADSSVAIPLVPGPLWIRMTWNQATKAVQFFTAPFSEAAPGAWTQLGTDGTINIASIFSSSEPLRIGSNSTASERYKGKYFRYIMKNGIAGTTVADVNFMRAAPGATTFTESSANAAVVTINTSGSPGSAIIGRTIAP
jgi:hypothetical protein